MQPIDKTSVWKVTPLAWISLIVVSATAVMFMTKYGLSSMVKNWFTREEYSYGVLIPFISLFLIWQKKDVLERIPFQGSWTGLFVSVIGGGLIYIGRLSALTFLMQYGFIIMLAGLILAYTGGKAFREMLVPILLLISMVPLPGLIFQNLSQSLQLISSQLGVWFTRLFDISVHLEGNVIDLGTYKLQVVEACSGLRYLFPLMTLGFIAAYLYKVSFWKRAFVFFSSIPITILMNSFRIGAIGMMVEYWGSSMADGFLHYFEGWVVFMVCMGAIILEMWFLARIGKDKQPLHKVFGLELPQTGNKHTSASPRSLPAAYWATASFVLLAVVTIALLPERASAKLDRQSFFNFPMVVGEWKGRQDRLESIYLDQLRMDDYILANFMDPGGQLINFYVAYYDSQTRDLSIHSPRACIPGGGWRIVDLTQIPMESVEVKGRPLRVNRALIQMGDNKQLVYYWFQQRGRYMTEEYQAKWYLFWDALTRNRTDGALVRLTTAVGPSEEITAADTRLIGFAKLINKPIENYIPD